MLVEHPIFTDDEDHRGIACYRRFEKGRQVGISDQLWMGIEQFILGQGKTWIGADYTVHPRHARISFDALNIVIEFTYIISSQDAATSLHR